jgi:hypothetical protein
MRDLLAVIKYVVGRCELCEEVEEDTYILTFRDGNRKYFLGLIVLKEYQDDELRRLLRKKGCS